MHSMLDHATFLLRVAWFILINNINVSGPIGWHFFVIVMHGITILLTELQSNCAALSQSNHVIFHVYLFIPFATTYNE